jgi:hypothetical protein
MSDYGGDDYGGGDAGYEYVHGFQFKLCWSAALAHTHTMQRIYTNAN